MKSFLYLSSLCVLLSACSGPATDQTADVGQTTQMIATDLPGTTISPGDIVVYVNTGALRYAKVVLTADGTILARTTDSTGTAMLLGVVELPSPSVLVVQRSQVPPSTLAVLDAN